MTRFPSSFSSLASRCCRNLFWATREPEDVLMFGREIPSHYVSRLSSFSMTSTLMLTTCSDQQHSQLWWSAQLGFLNHNSITSWYQSHSRTFFIAISVFVFFVDGHAFGCVAHPRFSAAVESILLQIHQLEVFVALVERHQEQFLALSTPGKFMKSTKTLKFYVKTSQDACEWEHKGKSR